MKLPAPAAGLSPVPVLPDRLPQPAQLNGTFAANTVLRLAQRLFEGEVIGSESVAVAADGSLLMLDKWGYLHTASPAPAGASDRSAGATAYTLSKQPLAYVGPGRPLGFHIDAAGDVVFCDSLKGLMLLELGGSASHCSSDGAVIQPRLRCLANSAAGRPISYANDLDIAADGRIYFSDSSIIPPALNNAAPRPWYDTMRSFSLTVLHGGATGRLLVHDPATAATSVLADGLWYANGVALAPDESFVAVVETCSMRVLRRWLQGPKAGELDVLIDRLPGWPDNIVRSSDGNFWLCLVAPDVPSVRRVMPKPWLRGLMAWLPEWVLPTKPQFGCILKVSPQGEVLQVLMDPDGSRVSHVSSCHEHAGKLFIGNLAKDYVSVLDLKEATAALAAAQAQQ